jgi:toxin ParE1/3/4
VTPKPVLRRARARADIEAAFDRYMQEDPDLAYDLIRELEEVIQVIGEFPATGSGRYAELLAIPDLRSRALQRFPYVVFYIERDDHIDVWRVLHGHRDIGSLLT